MNNFQEKVLTRMTRMSGHVHQTDFFFKVWSTKQSSGSNYKLISLLKDTSTSNAGEAGQVVHTVQGSHYKFRGRDGFQAPTALRGK